MKKIDVFYVEVGVLLDNTDKEFDKYNGVYDRKHGYYDTEWFYCKTIEEAKEIINRCVKINDKYISTPFYALIEKPFEDEPDVFNQYSEVIGSGAVEDVIYSVARLNGEVVENFIEGQSNCYYKYYLELYSFDVDKPYLIQSRFYSNLVDAESAFVKFREELDYVDEECKFNIVKTKFNINGEYEVIGYEKTY